MAAPLPASIRIGGALGGRLKPPEGKPSAAPSALNLLLNSVPGPGSPGYHLDAPSALCRLDSSNLPFGLKGQGIIAQSASPGAGPTAQRAKGL